MRVYDDITEVGGILDQLACQSAFLVADSLAYELSGAKNSLKKVLASRRVAVFSDFHPNPNMDELLRGIKSYRVVKPDVVLAVGGGTAIDLAKLIRFCVAQPDRELLELIKSPSVNPRQGAPLIAIPTTAGTGSEATHFAVVYVNHCKHSLAHSYVRPDFAVVDSTLTESLPANVTADTGLDALCQAIESMWCIHSTEQSLDDAVEAVCLAWQHLHAAVKHATRRNRMAMCRAAHLSGRAINITKTTAAHAISYPLTSEFNVPHGRAVALTIGPMLAFNSEVTDQDCNDPRGADFVRQTIHRISSLLGCQSAGQASQILQHFIASIGCPIRLSEIGVTTNEQIETIIDRVNVDRLANNPRRLTNENLSNLLEKIR